MTDHIITEAFPFGSYRADSVFTVVSGNTGCKKRFHRGEDLRHLLELVENRWSQGYTLTSVSY